MLRITRQTAGRRITLSLEGRLSGRFVAELLSACESSGSDVSLSLNLDGVTWIDQCGLEAVRSLIARNINVDGCSAFVGQLLKEPRS